MTAMHRYAFNTCAFLCVAPSLLYLSCVVCGVQRGT